MLETLIIRNALRKGAKVVGGLPGSWGAESVPSAFFSLFELDLSSEWRTAEGRAWLSVLAPACVKCMRPSQCRPRGSPFAVH